MIRCKHSHGQKDDKNLCGNYPRNYKYWVTEQYCIKNCNPIRRREAKKVYEH